jgi:hypothetical protein
VPRSAFSEYAGYDMSSDERFLVLRTKARVRARRLTHESLVAAAEKAERVAKCAKSDDARAAFNVLVQAYRAELDRRRSPR